MEIKVCWVYNHYEIYRNGKFYCSCDNQRELKEELREMSAT